METAKFLAVVSYQSDIRLKSRVINWSSRMYTTTTYGKNLLIVFVWLVENYLVLFWFSTVCVSISCLNCNFLMIPRRQAVWKNGRLHFVSVVFGLLLVSKSLTSHLPISLRIAMCISCLFIYFLLLYVWSKTEIYYSILQYVCCFMFAAFKSQLVYNDFIKGFVDVIIIVQSIEYSTLYFD